jgi:hypothetical protein
MVFTVLWRAIMRASRSHHLGVVGAAVAVPLAALGVSAWTSSGGHHGALALQGVVQEARDELLRLHVARRAIGSAPVRPFASLMRPTWLFYFNLLVPMYDITMDHLRVKPKPFYGVGGNLLVEDLRFGRQAVEDLLNDTFKPAV